jgi:pilus assembly protein CpaF
MASPVATTTSPAPARSGRLTAFDASLDFFLAPLRPFLRDPEVTEIMVNGPDFIYIEKEGRITRTSAKFGSEPDLQAAAANIAQFVGLPLSSDRPILDGRLPDGSRVCIVLGPIADSGTQINIRRFIRSAVDPQFLLERNAISPEAMEFLLLAVKAHQNLVISGGAGSGKTTLLNVLTSAFDASERIIVIEETRELQVQREHVVQLEARPADSYGRNAITLRDLFVASLRMRPDRIVVGEVRRGEALDLVQAMTSGHRGALSTLHAASAGDACRRLETMALMADVGLPLFALRRQVASAIDVLVQTVRLPSGRRLVSQVAEVTFEETLQTYVITDIFSLKDQRLQWTGNPSRLAADPALVALSGEINLTRQILAPEGSAV